MSAEMLKAAGFELDPVALLSQMMPIKGVAPETEFKVNIRDGWLVIAVKLPESKP